MKKFITRFRYPLLLFLIFIIAEAFVNPLGDYPLNDDWSYAKSVKILLQEHELNIGNWAAMTLVSHLLWGLMFTKLFGFSFVVLRISTLVLSLIGIGCLYHLSRKISGSERTAFLAALTLCFNPLYFNLSNTYMTDVSFITWLILFICCTYYLFQKNNYWMLIPILFISFMLVFMRQYGIIAPVSLVIGAFFVERRKIFLMSSGIVCSALVYYALKRYELELATYLGSWSPYKFSGKVGFTDLVFYENFINNVESRYQTIILHILVYCFPFACFFIGPSIRIYSRNQILLRASIALLLTVLLCDAAKFPIINVVQNMTVGMETFYQSWIANARQHNRYDLFPVVASCVKYLFSFGSIFFLMLQLFRKREKAETSIEPFLAFCGILFLLYVFMLLITDSYFDRYHLPLFALTLIFFSELAKGLKGKFLSGQFAFLFLTYVALAGTHDYLLLNSKRWEAFRELKSKGIHGDSINAGFEVNCWHEGITDWWFEFESLKNFQYLIQFDPEPGFKLLKEYPFQRFYPPRADKINIFVRASLPDSTRRKP